MGQLNVENEPSLYPSATCPLVKHSRTGFDPLELIASKCQGSFKCKHPSHSHLWVLLPIKIEASLESGELGGELGIKAIAVAVASDVMAANEVHGDGSEGRAPVVAGWALVCGHGRSSECAGAGCPESGTLSGHALRLVIVLVMLFHSNIPVHGGGAGSLVLTPAGCQSSSLRSIPVTDESSLSLVNTAGPSESGTVTVVCSVTLVVRYRSVAGVLMR